MYDVSPIVVTFQIQPFSTSMIMGERVITPSQEDEQQQWASQDFQYRASDETTSQLLFLGL